MSELLTTGEAAELLNVSPDTIRRWAREARIKVAIYPGGHQRFSREELSTYTRFKEPKE